MGLQSRRRGLEVKAHKKAGRLTPPCLFVKYPYTRSSKAPPTMSPKPQRAFFEIFS